MSRSHSCIRSVFIIKVSAVCQETNDNAVGRRASPQWTRFHRGSTASPSPTLRWQNPPCIKNVHKTRFALTKFLSLQNLVNGQYQTLGFGKLVRIDHVASQRCGG